MSEEMSEDLRERMWGDLSRDASERMSKEMSKDMEIDVIIAFFVLQEWPLRNAYKRFQARERLEAPELQTTVVTAGPQPGEATMGRG